MSKKIVGVVGFYFDNAVTKVALIKKDHPEWQAGKYNGIGGKLEPEDKGSFNAMMREAFEEAGIASGKWFELEVVQFTVYTLHVFAAKGDEEPVTQKSEEVKWINLGQELDDLLMTDSLVDEVFNYIQKAKLALI